MYTVVDIKKKTEYFPSVPTRRQLCEQQVSCAPCRLFFRFLALAQSSRVYSCAIRDAKMSPSICCFCFSRLVLSFLSILIPVPPTTGGHILHVVSVACYPHFSTHNGRVLISPRIVFDQNSNSYRCEKTLVQNQFE